MTPTATPPAYDTFARSSSVHEIPLDLLIPSPTQPRKHFDAGKLQELTEDIRTRGILSPLRVRPMAPDGERFEIVFGERRMRAARAAHLETAPCIIEELSDVEVLEQQIAENLQRADMTPLEEADAFRRLQDLDPKYREPKVLSAQVGKSLRTVRERLRLLTLIPDVRQALDADEITLGHAQLIAQLDATSQKAALKECFYPLYGEERGTRELKSLKDFEVWFNGAVPLDPDADAVEDAFPELAGAVAKARSAGGDIVRLSYWLSPGLKPKKGEPPILTQGQFREVKEKDACGVPGVFVVGRDRGHIIRVCIDQACAKHWPKSSPQSTSRRATSGGAAETKEQRDKRREREAKELRARQLAEARRATVEQRAMDKALESVGDVLSPTTQRAVLCDLLRGDVDSDAFGRRFGIKGGYISDVKQLKSIKDADLPKALAFCVLSAALQDGLDDVVAQAFKLFGVDVKRIDKEVAAEQAAQEALAQADAKPTAKKKQPVAKAKATKGKKR